MIELRADELAQLALERAQYRQLVAAVVGSGRAPAPRGIEITCIGNAAGADNMVRGRAAGGLLLRCGARTLIIDPGANSLACLARTGIDAYQITDVLASHAHDDHVGNLAGAVSAALRLGLGDAPDAHVIVCPALIDYGAPQATRSGFTLPAFAWQAHVHALHVQDGEVRRFDGQTVRIQRQVQVGPEIRVGAAPARHGPIQSTGFVIDTPHGRLGYSADTEYFEALAEAHRGADVLWLNLNTLDLGSIADTASGEPSGPVHGHLGYRGVCRLIEAVRPKTAFVSHLGAQLLDQRAAIEVLLRRRFEAAGTRVHCPASGERFVFEHGLAQPSAG